LVFEAPQIRGLKSLSSQSHPSNESRQKFIEEVLEEFPCIEVRRRRDLVYFAIPGMDMYIDVAHKSLAYRASSLLNQQLSPRL